MSDRDPRLGNKQDIGWGGQLRISQEVGQNPKSTVQLGTLTQEHFGQDPKLRSKQDISWEPGLRNKADVSEDPRRRTRHDFGWDACQRKRQNFGVVWLEFYQRFVPFNSVCRLLRSFDLENEHLTRLGSYADDVCSFLGHHFYEFENTLVAPPSFRYNPKMAAVKRGKWPLVIVNAN
ncbi:Hypothetical protein SMAX5B_019332 [Scophthalmus maximus]|uniref:Uncharacterized protein n=1 Tax=Scophthalmus maximus TaxID=52904 RepID=A0A2U9BWW0_SCOMX|nr:Hypothetical protein SMAX5B_019332 [Scophthalmus maximus]